MDKSKPLVTRKTLAELIRRRIGIHMTPHMIAIACSKGEGPEPVAKSGRRFLYEEDVGLAWGWSLVRPVEGGSQAA